MRVTENSNYETVRESIRKTREKMQGLQNQAASTKKLNTPSDDPLATAKILETRTEKLNSEQFLMNSRLAESYLENADHALSEISEIVGRAKDIALSQASGASSSEATRQGVSEEVKQLYAQALASANRRIGDRYIFSGFKTDRPAVNDDGRYQGDHGEIMVEVGKGVFLTSNIPGIEVFNTKPENSEDKLQSNPDMLEAQSRAPASALDEAQNPQSGPYGKLENVNLFNELQNLRIGLLTGDIHSIRTTLERFDDLQAKVISARTKIGSRIAGLQSTIQSNEKQTITNANLTSQLEDADMLQVVSDMAKEESVFKSSLQTSQKLLQPTLMDFLK